MSAEFDSALSVPSDEKTFQIPTIIAVCKNPSLEELIKRVQDVYGVYFSPELLKKLGDESNGAFFNGYDDYPLSVVKFSIDKRLNRDLEDLCKKILSGDVSHIIIRVRDLEGFGDHFFPLKLARDLAIAIPNVKIAFAFEDQVTIDKMKSVNDKYPFDGYLLSDLPAEFKKSKNGLCIGAASFYSGDPSVLGYKEMGLSPDFPLLVISEYGKGAGVGFYDRHISSGIYRNEFGIFIDEELARVAVEDKSSGRNPLYHLLELKDPLLRKRINPDSQPLAEYAGATNLYFGYGHKITSQKHFIKMVAHSEKEGNKNVDMMLILDDPEKLKDIFDDKLIRELADQGVGEVSIITDEAEKIQIDLSKPKKMRIFAKKFVSHSDFLTFLKMSQPLVMVTGDQSLSEAVSCRKKFVYECYPHKLHLCYSLRDVASEERDHLVQAFLYNSIVPERNFASLGDWGLEFNWDLEPKDYDSIVQKFLKNPDFMIQWEHYIKRLHSFSIRPNIIPYIIRKLAENIFPQLKSDQAKFVSYARRFYEKK